MKSIEGIYVIIDPEFINNEDPVEMTKKKIGHIINNSSDLLFYYNILSQEKKLFQIKAKTKIYMNTKIGASERIANEIFD